MSPFHLINSLAAAQVSVSIENGNLALSAPKGAVTAELLTAIKAQKFELLNFLQQESSIGQTITQADREQPLLLSFGQQRLWFIDQMESSTAYNLGETLRLFGSLNYSALNSAFSTIFERHECLRTCFIQDENGIPVQVVQEAKKCNISIADYSDLPTEEQQRRVREIHEQEAMQTFDLSCDLMLRARLLKLSESEHVLLVSMHHIAFDGWSTAILLREFAACYQAYLEGKDCDLPPLAIQYIDYAQWQRNWLKGEVLEKQMEYWEQQLADLPATHGLPLDRPRPAHQTFVGQTHSSHINQDLSAPLHRLCKQQGATLFMGLQAVFAVLLARFSGERDIVVGTPVANREQAEVAASIGFFANTLVLRTDLSDQPSFVDLLGRSRQMLLDAYAHQQVPFEQIVERLQPERSLSHGPLFQILLQMQNNERSDLVLSDLTIEGIDLGVNTARCDLTLDISEVDTGLALKWGYNTDLFDLVTIKRFARHFELLLAALVATPKNSVFDVEFLAPEEKELQLKNWNDTTADFPDQVCIHELFEHQVAKNPNAIALELENQQLSYSQLNQRANQLANYLITEKSVLPDSFVGVCLERSLDMVVAILGIYKAGAAYVPLDPGYPQARLNYMLEDARLNTVITHNQLLTSNVISAQQAICLDVDELQSLLARMPSDNPVTDVSPTSLAYMIYTSGSTGDPKGVMIEHRALVNRVHWMDRTYGCDHDDRILQKTPFSFDVSVWEFVWPLAAGARLVLAKPGGHQDAEYLSALIAEKQITKLHFVPSMLSSILSAGSLETCTSIKQVFCSGEALSVQQVEKFQQVCSWAELHNLYGPTEAAIDVSFWDCAAYNGSQSSIPIGRPIDNIQLHVLDNFNRPVPIGVPGELHIGGVGLARGYWNRADLTAEKFIVNPLSKYPDKERLYKTGDLVRWRANGEMEYLGRQDYQVKLRGFRIELGEIETVIGRYIGVVETVVTVYSNDHGKRLVAYLVAETGALDSREYTDGLREVLEKSLPSHMVPAHFAVLDEMPRTPNGKINRNALPAPDLSTEAAPFAVAESSLQHTICDIWRSLLKLDQMGIDDNVFSLGADSLVVIQAVAQLKASQIHTDVKAIFEFPTVRSLAANIEGAAEANGPLGAEKAGPGTAPLTLAQKWLFTLSSYEHPKWRNMSVFDSAFEIDLGILSLAFAQLLNTHDSLRSKFSKRDGEWVCEYDDYLEKADILVADINFSEDNTGELMAFMKRLDASLDFRAGPIIKLGYARVGDEQPDKLCMVVHHLVIDQYSYSVLFDDLFKAYLALVGGQQLKLPYSTPPRAVTEWTSDKKVQQDIFEQVHCWLRDKVPESSHILPRDHQGLANTLASQRSHSQRLSREQTQKLLDVCKISGSDSSPYEAVLAGLTNVICRWTGAPCMQVTAVSALRSDISRASGFDLTRTIGWLAGAKVIVLKPINQGRYTERLKDVREQLDAIPYGGFYIADFDAYTDRHGTHLITDEIKFNYKGVINSEGAIEDEGVLISRDDLVAQFGSDASDSEAVGNRDGTFWVEAAICDDQLVIKWEYSTNLHTEKTVRTLTECLIDELLNT